MKKSIFLLVIFSLLLWLFSASIFLGQWRPSWLPVAFLSLDFPKTTADLGQSFSLLDGLLSSFALTLGLAAIVIQIRQQADSNVIGALSIRLQFLIAESDRLENGIKELKSSSLRDVTLFNNMVEKKKRCLAECREIDKRLNMLLKKI